MNAVMKRPMFQPRIVRRQEGTPQGGEKSVDPYFGSGSTGLSSLQKFFTQFMDAPEKVRLDEIRDNAYSYYYNELLKGTDYPGPDQLKSARDQANILADQTVQTFISNFNPDIPSQGSIDFLKNKVPSEFYLNAIKDAAQDPRPGYGERPNIKTVSDVIDPDSSLRFLFPFTDFPKGRKQIGREVDELMKISEYNRNLPVAKAEGGEIESDAVGIASGLDEETPPGDPSKDGIAKVSPEQYVQLMNDVRGDEVPMEGRVQELAGVVGEKDAQATPLSVLALVQPVFEMQEQQGIAQAPGADQMMAQAQVQPQMAMGDQGPMMMNQGGIVHLADGPDERGIYEGMNVGPFNIQPDFGIYGAPEVKGAFDMGMITGAGQNPEPSLLYNLGTNTTPEAEYASIQNFLGGPRKSNMPLVTAATLIKEGLSLAGGKDPLEVAGDTALGLIGAKVQEDAAQKDFDQKLKLMAYNASTTKNAALSKATSDMQINAINKRYDFFTNKEIEKIKQEGQGMKDPEIYIKLNEDNQIVDFTVEDLKNPQGVKNIQEMLNSGYIPYSVYTKQSPTINLNIPGVTDGGGAQTSGAISGFFEGMGLKDGGEIVKRSQGSNQGGEQSGNKIITTTGKVIDLDALPSGPPSLAEQEMTGGVMFVDEQNMGKYEAKFQEGEQLFDRLIDARDLILENPDVVGFLAEMQQKLGPMALNLNTMFERFTGTDALESLSPGLVEQLRDPDLQRIDRLQQEITDKYAAYMQRPLSVRDRVAKILEQYRGKLKIEGFTDPTVAINALDDVIGAVAEQQDFYKKIMKKDYLGSFTEKSTSPTIIAREYGVKPFDQRVIQAQEAIKLYPDRKMDILMLLEQDLKGE